MISACLVRNSEIKLLKPTFISIGETYHTFNLTFSEKLMTGKKGRLKLYVYFFKCFENIIEWLELLVKYFIFLDFQLFLNWIYILCLRNFFFFAFYYFGGNINR